MTLRECAKREFKSFKLFKPFKSYEIFDRNVLNH